MSDTATFATKVQRFLREYNRIEVYKRRELTANLQLREEYKEDLIRTYNDLIDDVDQNSVPQDKKSDILLEFAGYLAKLKTALKLLRLKYTFDKGVFNHINIDLIVEDREFDGSISANSIDSSNNLSQQSTSATDTSNLDQSILQNTSTMAQTAPEFIAMVHRMINYKYDGDPLALDSFVDAVELLKDLCEPTNNTIFLKFVMTRLEGRAREAIITTPTKIDDITDQLKAGIKAESSKIIEGRILALRAERSSLTKFAEQAEKLADQFKRSLCLEGFSREKAKEITIEKTVEMCRKSARNDTVKAVLAASKFSEPKEVIAKMIIEINNIKQDKTNTPPYSHKFGNQNKNVGNFNNRPNNNRNGNGFQNNRNSNGNRNFSQNNRFNNNGQNNGNRSGYNNSNRNGNSGYGNQNYRNNSGQNNSRSSNDHNVRVVSGNETAPGNGGLQLQQ